LPESLQAKTVAADGEKTLSGVAPPRPDGFSTVERDTVLDHADKIGYEISRHVWDSGTRGQGWYNATHAEKQLVILRPEDPIGIANKICDDCLEFLRYDTKYSQTQRVATDPVRGTLVFQPDGSIVRPDGAPFTIERPGRLIEFPRLDLGPGPLETGAEAGVVP